MRTNNALTIFESLKFDTWLRPGLAVARSEFMKSLGLGTLTLICAVGLMFVAGYLIACAAEQPLLGLFSLLVPVGFVQIFGIGRPFLNYLERLESHNWVLRISSSLRKKLFGVLCCDRAGSTLQTGEVLELLAGDIDNLQNLYLRSFFPLVCAVVLWLLLSLAMLAVHPLCALCFFVAGGLLCLLVPVLAARVASGSQDAANSSAQMLARAVYDGIEGVSDWRFAGRKDDFLTCTLAALDSAAQANASVEQVLRRFDFVEHCAFVLTCVVVVLWAAVQFGAGGSPAQAGFAGRPQDWACALSIGVLALAEVVAPLVHAAAGANTHAAALTRLNGLSQVEDVCDKIASKNTAIVNTEAATRRNSRASDQAGSMAPTRPNIALNVTTMATTSLEVSNLGFSYNNAAWGTPAPAVLKGVTLRVSPGEKVAILGPSGSGKSTLLALLHGNLAPTSGQVIISAPGGNLAPAELGSDVCAYVSFVRQQNHLFSQTLFANLVLGDSSITRAQATQALNRVGLGGLLESLPQGLDTPIGEGGRAFSGGQEQRIALARVLLRQAPVVLLDEPTNGLDPATENSLLNTVMDVLDDKTLVMVTHHLACIERFDRVVFLEDGRIVIEGTPSELVATNARFQELFACDRGVLQ